MNEPISKFQIGRARPLTNAERQQRWRNRHRPRKRPLMQWGPDGNEWVPGRLKVQVTVVELPPTPAEWNPSATSVSGTNDRP